MEFKLGVWVSVPVISHESTFFAKVKQVAGVLCPSSPSLYSEFNVYSWEKLCKPPNNLNLCLVIVHLLNECKPLCFPSFVGL